MKYYEVDFTISPCSQDAQDILAALTGEAGFESFEETSTGMKAYVQQQLFDQAVLDTALEAFPFPSTHIIYKMREAEDRDWNEQWEQEGFEPIEVRGQRSDIRGQADGIIIHDGRHIPSSIQHQASNIISVEIDAHMAFGTGTHETTRMICATLLRLPLPGKRVLDCGCGTGILGICALLLGADHCTAYDIDEWSTDNTRHNAVINHVDDRLTALCGDATLLDTLVLDGVPAKFDIVMANINRNILIQDMERFVSVMSDDSTLILSGFYENDCTQLESKAQQFGLSLKEKRNDGDWACLTFVSPSHR